ncbi:homoserine kinase [Pontibacillus litoralis]|uniref:Homoserine kinase n=1 Tax=Pontibacillus litoralis JSM 072002 TaxID=1385512 RepID=A0A0A5G6A5_9BACI|nr:homoserine kinase [Pontibacillus litoralis]KGX86708.1 homoserine kinase [Pontibacillus litoralis JSM 072002]
MNSRSFRIPGSTSNLGPGFDSIGIALNLYLHITIYPADSLHFEALTPNLVGVVDQDDHLIVRTAQQVGAQYNKGPLPPATIKVSNDIPLARGLGSSAAAIVAGIEIADYLYELHLSTHEKISIATKMEGHPDNVVPSIIGGCVIAHVEEEEVLVQSLSVEGCSFLALIPNQQLKTSEARRVLPNQLLYQEAVSASSVANVLVAALAQHNWELAGKMMEKDYFHQPYRKSLIPRFDELQSFMKKQGAYGTFLSGAGPTVLSMVPTTCATEIQDQVTRTFLSHQCVLLQQDNKGVDYLVSE